MSRFKKPLLAVTLGIFLLGGLTACDTLPVSAYYGNYGRYAYDDYYYYPSQRIYYHPYSGYYYYPYRSRWIKVRKLPSRYRLPNRGRVVFKHENNKPWAHHREHRRRYRMKQERRVDADSDRRERRRNRELYERRLERVR